MRGGRQYIDIVKNIKGDVVLSTTHQNKYDAVLSDIKNFGVLRKFYLPVWEM